MKPSTPKTQEEIKAHAEKKEYQDFVHYTHQTLNKLNEAIVALGIQHERMFAKHQSLHNNLSIDFENHVSDVGLKIGRAFSVVDDIRVDTAQIQCEVRGELNLANQLYVTKTDLTKMIELLYQQQKMLDNSFKALKNFVESELMNLKASLDGKIKTASDDVKKNIPKVDLVEERFKSKLNDFYVDFAGLVTEVGRIREAVRYGEKKFENIYTLIERLKQGAPCPKQAN